MTNLTHINGQLVPYAGAAVADAFTARTKVPVELIPALPITPERIARERLAQKATIVGLDLYRAEEAEIGRVAAEFGHADEVVRPHNNLKIVAEARRRVAQQVEHLYVQEGND